MKLSHFVRKSPEIERLKNIGKSLGSTAPIQPVAEPVVEPQVTEAKKIEVSDTTDIQQKNREFAIAQLERAENHHHRKAAHKIKNYD